MLMGIFVINLQKIGENKAYQLTFNGVIARKFARYLYEKATIYMQRKYEKYFIISAA